LYEEFLHFHRGASFLEVCGNVISAAIQVSDVIKIARMEIFAQGIDMFSQAHFIGFFGRWLVGARAGLSDQIASGYQHRQKH
jgi:hypothetical protein